MNFKKTISAAVIAASVLALFSGCAKESSRVVQTPTVASLNTNYSGERIAVSVGRSNNQFIYSMFSGFISASSIAEVIQAAAPLPSSIGAVMW